MRGQKVYIIQGKELFHATLACPEVQGSRDDGIAWCLGRDAHFSRLRACGVCGVELLASLKAQWGALASGEKAARGLPDMQSWAPAAARDADVADPDVPYGPAVDLDDPRFSNASALGWGTSTFGQDPNEYLGNATDDDNDWRGHGVP